MPEEKEAQNTQEETKKDAQEKPQQEEKAEPAKQSGGFKQMLIPAAVVLVMTVIGFLLGRFLGYSDGPSKAQAATEQKPAKTDSADLLLNTASNERVWYYDLVPVATNLNEPGATRYVRALLTFEISGQVDQPKGIAFLNERMPIMINLLNIYFAGLGIEDINSDKQMKRIQSELLDIFNENLYPGSKPLIKRVLFKEFGIQ